jgi:hypothetical protein
MNSFFFISARSIQNLQITHMYILVRITPLQSCCRDYRIYIYKCQCWICHATVNLTSFLIINFYSFSFLGRGQRVMSLTNHEIWVATLKRSRTTALDQAKTWHMYVRAALMNFSCIWSVNQVWYKLMHLISHIYASIAGGIWTRLVDVQQNGSGAWRCAKNGQDFCLWGITAHKLSAGRACMRESWASWFR